MNRFQSLLKDSMYLVATAAIALAFGHYAPKWYQWWQGPYKNGDFSTHVQSQPHRLTLYSTSTCIHCANARTFLLQAGIPFNDQIIDQSQAAKAKYVLLEEQAVPVLVSKNRMLVGFNRDAYAEMGKSSLP